MPADPIYTDGDYSTAFATSLPEFSAPFAELGVNINYVLTQRWCQALASFSPLAVGTSHPDHADYTLMSEGPKTDLGGGIVEWVRTYAKLPDSFDRPSGNYIYTFPGYAGNIPTTSPTPPLYRPPKTKSALLTITRDFFQTDDPENDIAQIEAQTYYFEDTESTPEPLLLYDEADFGISTVPSRTDYEAMIGNDYLVVEDSSVELWMGNIYIRTTKKVLAQ